MACFNPRPVYKPGDTSDLSFLANPDKCFNPRPVYKPGDTGVMGKGAAYVLVSIHARFISRAIHLLADPIADALLFQSTPGL